MLDYASLAAVAAVVREGSFERAASVLSVTPSAVSQRIKALEDRLGSVLIVRGQPCVATETGKRICRHVEQVGMLEHDLRGALPALVPRSALAERVTLRIAVNADSLGTWFVGAMGAFVTAGGALLDVAIDDQDHTVDWLKSGAVLAAVTASAKPVQGCNSIPLGKLRYAAVASPQFVAHHFRDGVNATSLAGAPTLTFNHKDRLQAQWMRSLCKRDIDAPTHWLPSTQAFIDAALHGIAWGMNPVSLVREHLTSGALVELVPGRELAVPLYWQNSRLQIPMLTELTRCVVSAAGALRAV
ncbi:MAG TPA: LysR family transcriptional regulator ArgP [Steroidobacteraceae bacterium]|jgi:LysR family transcriptional regulator (chromosome initiation inhibitor)